MASAMSPAGSGRSTLNPLSTGVHVSGRASPRIVTCASGSGRMPVMCSFPSGAAACGSMTMPYAVPPLRVNRTEPDWYGERGRVP